MSSLLVLGSDGMLGKAVVEAAYLKGVVPSKVKRGELSDIPILVEYADAVINCVGAIPQRGYSPTEMILANSYIPHKVAEACESAKKKLVLVSTDCVFSGRSFRYNGVRNTVNDDPDPVDLYGRTKLIGEVVNDYTAVVRTSFIGFNHGFLAWLIANKGGTIEGWQNAHWSGSTVYEVARRLVDFATGSDFKPGIHHFSTMKRINKFELAILMNKILDLRITIVSNATVNINRALEPTTEISPVNDVLPELIGKYKALALK